MENSRTGNIPAKKLSPLAQGSKRELMLSSKVMRDEYEKKKALEERETNKRLRQSKRTNNRYGKKNEFKMFYDNGNLPLRIEYSSKNPIRWMIDDPMENLDFHYYLPLFVDGLHCAEHPYGKLAREGLKELLVFGGDKVLSVIPQLILPLKTVLESGDLEIVIQGQIALQLLVKSNENSGELLVPYYRQLLHSFRSYIDGNVKWESSGDKNKSKNIGQLCRETLALLESSGGPDAFESIKEIIPTYEGSSY